MKTGALLLSIALCLATGPLVGQGLATDAWPTYAGDYSQRRYSPLRQIDQTNVRHLTLAWLRRLTAGPGGREDGPGALAQGDRRFQPAVLLHHGTRGGRGSRAGRYGRRSRRAGFSAVVRSADRRPPVEVLHGADEPGGSGPGDVGEPRRGTPRRRAGVDAGLVRPRDASVHLRDRESDAGVHGQAARTARRTLQSVHLLGCGAERRHRKASVVLPDVA